MGPWGGFCLGLAVAVLVNLVTALFSREKGLRLIPWLWFYVSLHLVAVFINSDFMKGEIMKMTHKGNHSWPSYAFVMLIAASLAGFYWHGINFAVDKLAAATQEKPADSPPDKKEGDKKKESDKKDVPPAKAPQKDSKQKQNPQVSQESHGDNSPNVGSITQGPGSIAQVGGQGNQATINNFGARLPRLVKVSETGAANPDGSYTTECVLRIESDVAPGKLTFQVKAQDLQEVTFAPNVAIAGIALNNVMQGSDFYRATVFGPSGEYLLSVKTKQKTHIDVGASFN